MNSILGVEVDVHPRVLVLCGSYWGDGIAKFALAKPDDAGSNRQNGGGQGAAVLTVAGSYRSMACSSVSCERSAICCRLPGSTACWSE